MFKSATVITDPLIELLAIKLYEHDFQGKWPVKDSGPSWIALPEEDRDLYREIARGNKIMRLSS